MSSSSHESSDRLLHWVLGIPLVLLPVLLGGARPWFWGTVAAFFFVGVTLLLWLDTSSLRWGLAWKPAVVVCLFIAYAFIQAASLPPSWLEAISPHRFEWLRDTAKVLGQPVVQGTSISYEPIITGMDGIFWIFLAVYAWSFRVTLRGERSLRWLWKLLFALAATEALYGLVQVLIPQLGVLWTNLGQAWYHGMARGTFINKNHYAAFLNMLWPLLLVRCLSIGESSGELRRTGAHDVSSAKEKLRQKQIFLSLIVGLIPLAVVFSQSRGGTIGAIIAMTVLAVLLKTRRKGLLALMVMVWVVTLSYGSIIGFDEVISRFDQMEKDAPGRFQLWQDTLGMIHDHPWTGTGLGTYATVFKTYQLHIPEGLQASHAHSDYVELVAELGWPVAVVIFLLVWGYWWRGAIREWKVGKALRLKGMGANGLDPPAGGRAAAREERSRESHLIAVGALAGSAAFLCHCWVDFNWQIPANQLYFVVLLVLIQPLGRRREETAGGGAG